MISFDLKRTSLHNEFVIMIEVPLHYFQLEIFTTSLPLTTFLSDQEICIGAL